MKRNEKLEKTILLAHHKLKQIDAKNLGTEEENQEYNRLLIEKAIMTKKLNDKKENKLKDFFKKLRRKANGKTLICDNF